MRQVHGRISVIVDIDNHWNLKNIEAKNLLHQICNPFMLLGSCPNHVDHSNRLQSAHAICKAAGCKMKKHRQLLRIREVHLL